MGPYSWLIYIPRYQLSRTVCDTFPRLPFFIAEIFASSLVLLYLTSIHVRLGASSKYLCSWAVDRISSTIPRSFRKQNSISYSPDTGRREKALHMWPAKIVSGDHNPALSWVGGTYFHHKSFSTSQLSLSSRVVPLTTSSASFRRGGFEPQRFRSAYR